MSGALDGVRVLDASNMIAGPLAGTLLADLGADVIKIEQPAGGDPLRNHGYDRDGVPLWWKVLGRNKRSVTLYLGSSEGQDIFKRLATDVDVVIENYRVGTMARWGLDYGTLSAANPSLIMAHVTGFGQIGPRASEPAFGTLAEAMSGFAHRTGDPDGPPVLPPFGLADTTTGLTGALAIMTALFHRERTGEGQEIDIAIAEPLLTLLEPQVITYDQLGVALGRTGNRSEMNAPRDLYPTADGRWIAISASTFSTVERLVKLVGAEHLLQEDWINTAHGRSANVDQLDAVIIPWTRARNHDEVIDICAATGVPASLVYSAAEILTDEQFLAIGAIAEVDDDELGTVRMPNVPFRLSRTPGSVRWAGPPLGHHTAEVLAAIGIDEAEIERLRTRGIV